MAPAAETRRSSLRSGPGWVPGRRSGRGPSRSVTRSPRRPRSSSGSPSSTASSVALASTLWSGPRLGCRGERSARVVSRIFAWLEHHRSIHPARSVSGAATGHALANREALTAFREDPALPLDSDRSEGALRRIALGRKNHLVVGNDDAGAGAPGSSRGWRPACGTPSSRSTTWRRCSSGRSSEPRRPPPAPADAALAGR
jgi:hypothetical protein